VSVARFLFTLLLSLGSSGLDQNDLRISIAHIETADSKPSNPEFAITLENQGDSDLVVLLGALVGKKLYPHAISLVLTDQSGRVSNLRYRGPLRVGGRVDPYIVGLPSHATYVLRLALAQFVSPYTGEGLTTPPADGNLDPRLPSGSFAIQATLQEPGEKNLGADVHGNRLMNLWTGTVSSNVLSFSVTPRSAGRSPASPEDRFALIKALEHEAMLHRRHDVAVRQGQHPPPLDDPERLPQLARAVGKLHDPASIPALAAAMWSGFAAIRPLAAFGEQAVPAILSVEASPESGTDSINSALITLRFIVEGASERGGLSEATRTDVRRVAARRLTSSGSPTTLWWAIDLAWSLQDEELRHSVEVLATDANAVAARGITDPGLIEQTQKRAAARVAGSPPLPRP
jgi:hypothetical protein